ncbi:hypothetical protein Pelo_7179 [Pelomyxa schiedti]|nr:hypothetical protein Pelo_7179 [Pelomyxa schiedti]
MFSNTHRAIVKMYHPPGTSPTYDIRSLGVKSHEVLRKCQSEPQKVDARHFVEYTHRKRLKVFSTDDLAHPCNVIHNDTRRYFRCGAGFIVLRELDGRFLIIDAATGTVPISPGFENYGLEVWFSQ